MRLRLWLPSFEKKLPIAPSCYPAAAVSQPERRAVRYDDYGVDEDGAAVPPSSPAKAGSTVELEFQDFTPADFAGSDGAVQYDDPRVSDRELVRVSSGLLSRPQLLREHHSAR